MLQFADSETQRLLRSTARSFLANAYPWERLYRIESGAERIGEADVQAMAGLGWFELLAGGASLLDAAAVIEEVGYAGVPSPVASANVAAYLLSGAGQSELAGPCALSDATRAFANTSRLTLRDGAVSGELPLVPFADVCARVLAPATSDGGPAFVALALRGARLSDVQQLDRRSFSVTFNNAEALVLATGAKALELHERADALSTALGLIELTGALQRTLELTAQHITTRQQFGQPIGKFQAARHRAAEILMQVDTTRWAAYHALWRFESDPADTDEIWLAKHWAVRAVDRVFQNAHMLHGGVGVGMEHPLHLFTQGAAASAVRGGTMSEMVRRALAHLRSA